MLSLLRISRFLTLAILGWGMLACSVLPESLQQTDASLPLLTPEQQKELLDMLKSHKGNEALMQQWRQSQTGVTRLLAIESDLKVLIEQLSELSSEQSSNGEQYIAAQTSESAQVAEKPITPQQTKVDILPYQSDTQNQDAYVPVYKASLGDNTQLAGLIGIQLSAMKSPATIAKLWQQLVKLQPRLLGDLSPVTEAVERSSGTIYRLKAGPFDNKATAEMHCNKLRQVKISCIVTQYAENAMYLPVN
jgi:cell division protein FtsN